VVGLQSVGPRQCVLLVFNDPSSSRLGVLLLLVRVSVRLGTNLFLLYAKEGVTAVAPHKEAIGRW
jgi:hypothetical protein